MGHFIAGDSQFVNRMLSDLIYRSNRMGEYRPSTFVILLGFCTLAVDSV
jgi:hypothetical protein